MKKNASWGIFAAAALSFLLIAIALLKVSANENHSRKTINVMSFNIRYDNPNDRDNAWTNRKEMVAETIRFHKIDIAGLQEALLHQVRDLETLLPEYNWFGVGREDGREEGEFTPVFYLRSRFKILCQSFFWLSDTPDRPGKAWDAACPRIATWAKIKDRYAGKIFFLFNTHLDHMGETARIKSAELLLKKINKLAEENPIILTGDFNCTEKEQPYKILTSGIDQLSGLSDTYYLTKFKPYGSTQTFNGYRDAIHPDLRIDFIFVGKTDEVFRCGIISERWDGSFVSDHNAVLTELKLN
jgi:endonuclease/exonuclease/phosphatase family metal-dependent hydrolase